MRIPGLLKLMGIAFFALAMLTLLFLALPFQPYRQLEFISVPREVCPGQPVETEVARAVEVPTLGSLVNAEVTSTWSQVDGAGHESQGPTPIPLEETTGEVINSPVGRTAPLTPGEWTLSASTKINGYMGYMPRHPIIHTAAPNTTTVLDYGSEECRYPGDTLATRGESSS